MHFQPLIHNFRAMSTTQTLCQLGGIIVIFAMSTTETLCQLRCQQQMLFMGTTMSKANVIYVNYYVNNNILQIINVNNDYFHVNGLYYLCQQQRFTYNSCQQQCFTYNSCR